LNSGYYGVIGVLIAILVVMPLWKAYSRKRNERQGAPTAPHVDVPAGSGLVTVRRPYAGLQGAVRSLTVEVDGTPRGKVKAGKALAVALQPGVHMVRVTIGRNSSAPLHFEVTPGASVFYETEIVPGAFSSTIDLRRVEAQTAV